MTPVERRLKRGEIEGQRVRSEIRGAITSADPEGRLWWDAPGLQRAILRHAGRLRALATLSAILRRMVAEGAIERRSADLPQYRLTCERVRP